MQAKRKGKAGVFTRPSPDRPLSSSSLESLLPNLSLYEKTEAKKPVIGAFSSMEELFSEEVVNEATEKMEDIIPFNTSAMVVVSLP